MKALVNISIELYLIYVVSDYRIKYAHNDHINDFSIFGIQIGIFTNMIFKFITSEATSKFWKHHILFCIISIKFVSHQIHIHVWGFSMMLLLGLIPVVSHGRLSHSQHARVLPWGISPHTAYNQTKMSNHWNQNSFVSQKIRLFSKALKPKASFAHYITMVPLTDGMPGFFPEVPFPT